MKKPHRTSEATIVMLVKLLYGILDEPQQYAADQVIRGAVKSQVKLAAYDNPELGIVGCSLNTFKKLCSGLGEGFEGVEDLRLLVNRAFSKLKTKKTKPGSRRSLQDDKAKLQKVISAQDVDLQRLTLVITELMRLSLDLATLDLVSPKEYYDLEIKKIMKILGTRRL
ncbi:MULTISPECIES: hypothetical protein [Pseudomonas]|uniref:Uncharacterized protein n=1 Tax=Pseudomonas agarici TaxID=46677 RepID=A0A0X1SYE5_PSEAA|nr:MULTISPECIES: hypothetical protein [Pseudomonas]AMB84838.1 hypothetical protein AWM79_05755 [Pseudomonas agarici]